MTVGNRVCCTREDGSKYRHTCACPSANLVTVSSEKDATLCGFDQYTDVGVPLASPPLKFKRRANTIIDWKFKNEVCRFCDDQSETVGDINTTYTLNNNGNVVQDYSTNLELDPPVCSPEGVSSIFASYTSEGFLCGVSSGSQNNSTEPGVFIDQGVIDSGSTVSDGGPYDGTRIAEASAVSGGTQVATGWDYLISGYSTATCDNGDIVETYGQFKFTTTLSNQDTEEDALNRTDSVSGTFLSSIWETRSTGFSFIKRTVDYCVLCTNLQSGLDYEGEIPLQKREAIIGTVDDWVAEPSTSFSFTANNKFHIEGGSLNSSITDQEFIDEDYSLDPTDYGLAASELVVVPSTELTIVQGYEYEIGDNPNGDTVYCEKSP